MKEVEMTKEDKEREMKWKVEDAIRNLTEYKKAIEDKEVKEKVIKELEKRANEYKTIAKEL